MKKFTLCLVLLAVLALIASPALAKNNNGNHGKPAPQVTVNVGFANATGGAFGTSPSSILNSGAVSTTASGPRGSTASASGFGTASSNHGGVVGATSSAVSGVVNVGNARN